MNPVSSGGNMSYQGGGPGWMPPPPIQGVNDGGNGGNGGVSGYKPPPRRLPPGFAPPPQSFSPRFGPVGISGNPFQGGIQTAGPMTYPPTPAPQQMPGWAGYIQFLQGMQRPQGLPNNPMYLPPQQQPPNWFLPPPQIQGY
jgi:hypothetical protein